MEKKTETTKGYVEFILGLDRVYIRIMDKKMETTKGYVEFVLWLDRVYIWIVEKKMGGGVYKHGSHNLACPKPLT